MSETSGTKSAEADAAYRVLARKYRPHSFDDLIGQEPMVRTLTNAFETGRIAQAWMLTGVRGVGKTTTARILARALNYETGEIDQPTIHMAEPGIHCQAIMEGRHVDVVEMDAASHTGIDDIREIIAQVRYRPVSARYKVYIIDEVHMLSTQAFNGLLKTLEEPPEHVKFVFATTEIRKVPITVLSRCQRFDLRRVESATLIGHLKQIAEKEKVEIEDDALRLIARAAEGSVRDSLSLTDQAIAHGAGAVTAGAVRDMLGLADRVRVIDLFEYIMKGDAASALVELRDQYTVGADPAIVLGDLADFTHLVTTLRYAPEAAEDAVLSPDEAERGLAYSKTLSIRTLGQVWQMLLKALEETRNADSPRQAAEMALIRIAHAADLPSPDDLLKLLKDGGSEGLPAPKSDQGEGTSLTPAASPTNERQQAAPPTENRPGRQPPAPPTGNVSQPPQDGNASAHATASRPARTPLSLATSAAPEVVPQRVLAQQPVKPAVEIADLVALAELAKHNRDSRLEAWIRRYVRLKSIGPRRLEIGVTDEAPERLAGELTRKLHDWTGARWSVTVTSGVTGQTLEETKKEKRLALLRDAEQDPAVAAVLKAFPGARIADVRLRGEMVAEEAEAEFAAGFDQADGDLSSTELDPGLDYEGDRDDIGENDFASSEDDHSEDR
ncbi:DNA polymerase III subunits gamma and tau [Fulvimarina pelagi HTCC2506]|uniref:DNA polymerase III subunit gamma/tau n=1 Tax=Fulvimarina pelagi HTCC2506 TaxID=314231 RepID=Q0G7Q4_9HYPH|nr:DNA polymerase III subunit gamma/tau [Fulvimarina pelagi]EAU42310.1 DNA polymerase III subunits gamma and tau [Fulvimarina pelagi HTCC2506]